jgi:DNA-binding HxlR family transcriptional regulator
MPPPSATQNVTYMRYILCSVKVVGQVLGAGRRSKARPTLERALERALAMANSTVKSPGQKVRGSQTGRPIMVLLDVLGQRWTLRVLWELGGTRATFRMLRIKCDDVSPTLLNKRLKHLRELGLVDLNEAGFGLTPTGKALTKKLVGLDAWANSWAQTLENTPHTNGPAGNATGI